MKKLSFILGIMLSTFVIAAPEDMIVQTWDAGCEHTMTTNHFELAPGDLVEIDLNLLECNIQEPKGLLYFGYFTTKNSSKPLTKQNKVQLTLVDNDGIEITNNIGAIFIEVTTSGQFTLYAENINRNKTVKIRLRSSLLD